VGTNPLPRKGSRISGIGRLLAASTLLVTIPSATASQISAKLTMARRPNAMIHSSGPAVGPKPSASATPTTTAMAIIVWIRLPTTWPVSTDTRAIAMVLNRATMPSVMSMATEIATPWAAPAAASRMIPGMT
jgi:hypothetical protein